MKNPSQDLPTNKHTNIEVNLNIKLFNKPTELIVLCFNEATLCVEVLIRRINYVFLQNFCNKHAISSVFRVEAEIKLSNIMYGKCYF